jgi:hypothetical protein
MNNDMMNAFFEFGGGIAILNHCRVLYKDKTVNGVSVLSTIFFTTWGFWNVYYYPSLNQWVSFYGGLVIAFANLLWVILLLCYTLNKPKITLDLK